MKSPKTIGDQVAKNEPLFEIHTESKAQLEFARAYAASHPTIVRYGS